jgi:CDP-glycerol glycerophosphotransferase (TagB/SpsB family)
LKDIKNTTLIIKPHPEDKSRIEEIKSIIIEKSRIVSDINLYSLLTVSDIVITVNSTVGLEALTLYKPVVVLGQAIYGNKGFTYDLKEKIELRDLIFQALYDANSEAFNEREFFRFFVYILKNILFNLDFNEDCWNSRNNILKNVIKEMKKNYDIEIKINDAINEITRSNSRYINIFNELKRDNINEKMKSVFLKGFSKQTINFLLSSEKNNFVRFKCDCFSRSITRVVTLLLRSSFKKYHLALFAEPLEGKSKIIWRLIRAKHKEIL